MVVQKNWLTSLITSFALSGIPQEYETQTYIKRMRAL